MRRLVILVTLLLTACRGIAVSPPPPSLAEGEIPDATAPFRAYAAEHRDAFGGIYLDGGIVVLQFTDELAPHDAALQARGIVAGRYRLERVERTEDELRELQDRVTADMAGQPLEGYEFLSSGIDVFTNRVELTVKSNQPGAEEVLRDRYDAGDALALHVFPLVTEWVQPDAGDGWRLLDHGEVRESYSVRVATDAATSAALWAALGLGGEAPEVDFSASVVASFAQGIGSSCPELRLDAIRVEDGAVYPVFSDPLMPRACTADLVGGQAFVVAIDRTALPPAPYRVRLVPPGERLPCGGDCGDGLSSEVIVD